MENYCLVSAIQSVTCKQNKSNKAIQIEWNDIIQYNKTRTASY